jgi:hypothetical protein
MLNAAIKLLNAIMTFDGTVNFEGTWQGTIDVEVATKLIEQMTCHPVR